MNPGMEPTRVRLDRALQAWGSADFETVFKAEVAQLGAECLPLQQGLSHSSHVAEGALTVVVHAATGLEETLRVRAGIFYQGSVGGCSCADDPTPATENTEYCEVMIDIDRRTAAATIRLSER